MSGEIRGGRSTTAEVERARIAGEMSEGRQRTVALFHSLGDDVLARQIRPFVSPLLWDLGHIANFEKRWLIDAIDGRGGELEKRFDALDTPRERRGALRLPGKREVFAELERVRREVLARLAQLDPASGDPIMRQGYVYRMVMQHEAQHQETMLQVLDIPDDGWDDLGAEWTRAAPKEHTSPVLDADEERARVEVPAGSFLLGTRDRERAYDNERPQHEAATPAFAIERYPVTNRRWIEFIEDGGYRRRELWSAGGRKWLEAERMRCPQAWVQRDAAWTTRRFGHEVALDPSEPVQHVSFWEAEAFARWAGGRLPTETEWEKAAAWDPAAGRSRCYPWGDARAEYEGVRAGDSSGESPARLRTGPPRVGSRPDRASAFGVHDLLGSVYQWTSTEFDGYPGFVAFPYAEYSQVFFGRGYRVLRGASWASAEPLRRNTYRNWDLPQRRQIFAGVRVAYDV